MGILKNYKFLLATIFAMLFVAIVLPSSTSALQTAPYKLNFQGRLTDSNGNAKAAGSYNIKFRLMSASSGGSNLWQADRVRGASDYRVTVTTGGLFSVQLGDTTLGDPALSPSLFNTQTNATVYLEVELPTPATATCSTNGCASFTEGAMTPRSLVGSSAYAMNADTLDGVDSASFVQLSSNNTFTGTFLHKNSSNSTTAFQIQKADGTPLLVADTSNLALKVGGGDVSPDASPALLILDYKNTSGDPTGTDGAMYYNSNSGKFRCYEDGVWKDCIARARSRFEFHNDLTNDIAYANGLPVDALFTAGSAGTGSAFTHLVGETNHPGIMRLTLGATFGQGIAELATNYDTTNPIIFGGGAWGFTSQVRIATLSDGTNRYAAMSGFYDTANSMAPSNGCYLKYIDNVNSGKWQGVCENANTASTCDTTVSVATATWYDLRVTVNAAANSAKFTVNGTSCTVSTNIPTTNDITAGLGLVRSAGSTNRTMDCDSFEITATGLSR